MKPTKRVAVIDVGSNTIRLLIADISGREIKKVHTERVVTRLGKKIEKNKVLNKESIKKSIEFLEKFKSIVESFNVHRLIAVGTSALRDAKDGEIFCNFVREKIGIDLKIISGDEEAYFTLEGVKAGIPNLKPPLFTVDIGGGSIDWVYQNRFTERGSINYGVIKLYERFFTSEIDLNSAYENLKEFINQLINSSIPRKEVKNLIATGGTPVTLALIENKQAEYSPDSVHGTVLSTEKLKKMVKEVILTGLKNWENSIYIPQDRFDLLLPGMVILETFAEYLKAESIIISDYGIIEGIMINYERFCYNNKL